MINLTCPKCKKKFVLNFNDSDKELICDCCGTIIIKNKVENEN